MAQPKSTAPTISTGQSANQSTGQNPAGDKVDMVNAALNAACREASQAGWETTIEAINLVLAAAEPNGPTSVSVDTIMLAEAKIAAALAEITHMVDLTDKMRTASPSGLSH